MIEFGTDWRISMLSEGITQECIFKEYANESKNCENGDVNPNEHWISVINTLDAKLQKKEEAHLCNSSRSEEELGVLRADIQSKVDDYILQYVVTPAWALPPRAVSNNDNFTSVTMESLPCDSSTKKKTKDKRRFFLTDTMRSCALTSVVTLASSIDSADCTDCSITLTDVRKQLVSITSEFTAKKHKR